MLTMIMIMIVTLPGGEGTQICSYIIGNGYPARACKNSLLSELTALTPRSLQPGCLRPERVPWLEPAPTQPTDGNHTADPRPPPHTLDSSGTGEVCRHVHIVGAL